MADLANATGGLEKFNNHNYDYWRSCLESYLQGQDLWEVVGGSETAAPTRENAEALRRWAGKAMYVRAEDNRIKGTVGTYSFGRPKDQNRLGTRWQHYLPGPTMLCSTPLSGRSPRGRDRPVVHESDLCHEISQLDPESRISETRMRRIITRGLKPEYKGFMTAIRGWPTQPSPLELESLLANQETMARQMASVSVKDEEEALFTRGARSKKTETAESSRRREGSLQGGAWRDRR